MKELFILLITLLLVCGCNATKGKRNKEVTEPGLSNLLSLVDKEKQYAYSVDYDTIYNLKFIFEEHKKYREELWDKISSKKIHGQFNNCFLLEHFSVYDQETDSPTSNYYYALIFKIENNKSEFYDIEISNRREYIKRISLNDEDEELLRKWLNTKSEVKRETKPVYLKNDNQEDILIISKLTDRGSFCQIIFNPMFYSLFMTHEMSEEEKQFHLDLNVLSYFYFLTGTGSPF
jgi:hypothetical protein